MCSVMLLHHVALGYGCPSAPPPSVSAMSRLYCFQVEVTRLIKKKKRFFFFLLFMYIRVLPGLIK